MTGAAQSTPKLLIGPMLRYLDAHSATIWVEVDTACVVAVSAGDTVSGTAATFCVCGHHYAIVVVDGLTAGEAMAYEVSLDGAQVWPGADGWPASLLRPPAGEAPLRIAFGSCRAAAPLDDGEWGIDALHALAERMRTTKPADWPDLLALVGDQIYADDNLSPATRSFIAAHRGPGQGPDDEVVNVDEYRFLYTESWTPEPIRWLFSTLPSVMIFDDHDVRDDWNTSEPWRRMMQAKAWWRERITSGLLTYWIYQHLGNLTPAQLACDPILAALQAHPGDGEHILREHARKADSAADGGEGVHWSYRRDYGRVRLLVLDSRCNRVVDGTQRLMVSDAEWQWFDEQCTGDIDHLLIVTSLPYLLPRAVHGLEALTEAIAGGEWGPRSARQAEKLRQGADLEHWAAFETSFRRMRKVIASVASGRRGSPPATITFLSGDVHFSYLAEAHLTEEGPSPTRVLQAVCSPLRNPLDTKMRLAERFATSKAGGALGRLLTERAHASTPGLSWTVTHGPAFGNTLGELTASGRDLDVAMSAAQPGPTLSPSCTVRATGGSARPGDPVAKHQHAVDLGEGEQIEAQRLVRLIPAGNPLSQPAHERWRERQAELVNEPRGEQEPIDRRAALAEHEANTAVGQLRHRRIQIDLGVAGDDQLGHFGSRRLPICRNSGVGDHVRTLRNRIGRRRIKEPGRPVHLPGIGDDGNARQRCLTASFPLGHQLRRELGLAVILFAGRWPHRPG